MFQRFSTDTFNWIFIIGVILLIVEVAFFHGGLVFTVFFSSLFVFIGRKKYNRFLGKIVFWLGLISLVIAIFNTIAVRFVLVVGIILFLINYKRSKKNPETIVPMFDEVDVQGGSLIKIEPLFQQRLFGDQSTGETAYKWNDINSLGGFGDRIVDLSNTVLPEQAVILIRHFVGNVKIYVPYEIEISINHCAFFGKAKVLGEHELNMLNRSISYRTAQYSSNKPRVNIITSVWSGDLEVKRI